MTVNIRFDGFANIPNEDAWPDGVPEDPTAQAFASLMERDGTKLKVLAGYALTWDLEVHVSIDNGPEVEVWAP